MESLILTFQASWTFCQNQLEHVVNEFYELLSIYAPSQVSQGMVPEPVVSTSPGNQGKFSGPNPTESESLKAGPENIL